MHHLTGHNPARRQGLDISEHYKYVQAFPIILYPYCHVFRTSTSYPSEILLLYQRWKSHFLPSLAVNAILRLRIGTVAMLWRRLAA